MLNDFFEDFIKVDLKKVSDKQGGFITTAIEGLQFTAGLTTSKTTNKLIGEQYGAENGYIMALPKEVVLNIGEIIKKKDSSNYYKVVNDPNDYKTPSISNMDFKQALLVRYILPK